MLYSFFWVIPRRLNFMCRCFGTLCSIFIGRFNKIYENGTYSVPKRRHIKFRRRGITKKKEYKVLNVKKPRCGKLNPSTDPNVIFLICITCARAACDSANRLTVFTLLLYRYFARLPYHHYHKRLDHQHRYHQEPWRMRQDFLFKTL